MSSACKLIRRLLYDDGYTIKGVQKLFKEQRAQNAATAVFDAQLPFGPEDSFAPGDEKRTFRASLPRRPSNPNRRRARSLGGAVGARAAPVG